MRFMLQGPVLHPSPSLSEIKEAPSVEWRAGEGRAGLLKLDLLLLLVFPLLLLALLDMKLKRGIFQRRTCVCACACAYV